MTEPWRALVPRSVESALAAFDFGVFRGASVAVAVPDATRPFDPQWIRGLLERLSAQTNEVTVVVGLGLHRPLTQSEWAPYRAVSESLARLVQHDAEAANLIRFEDLEVLGQRLPRTFDPVMGRADVIVGVGMVEPHQYAGYSGGPKTVAIGCAGKATINVLHGCRLLAHPDVRIGKSVGNPFQTALRESVRALAPFYTLSIVPGPGTCFFGPLDSSYAEAVDEAQRTAYHELSELQDAFVLEVPVEKAVSFYQASRAATYVAEVERTALRPGGLLLVKADCPEGLGAGAGEKSFAAALSRGRAALLSDLAEGRDLGGGAQRAMVLARTLEKFRIGWVTDQRHPALEALGVERFSSVPSELAGAMRINPFEKLPRLGGP